MMDAAVFERFRSRLQARHQSLTRWLATAPAAQRRLRLGPAEDGAAQAHVEVLAQAITRAADHSLGQCDVCREPVEPGRLEMDYACCVCLDHLTSTERRRLEEELELAVRVQRALLPGEPPALPGVDVAAFSRPATIVSGDFFDFFSLPHEAQSLVIGDVAGHGMSASLLMASVQTALHALAPEHDRPADLVQRLNRLFYHNVRMTSFITLFLGRLDPGSARLTYCNAGHNPPLLFRPTGQPQIRWLEPTAAAIGLVEDPVFGTADLNLQPGDILLLYTDGATEATNAEFVEFGPERLAALVRANAHLPARSLVAALRQQLATFTAGHPLADDMTLVAFKMG